MIVTLKALKRLGLQPENTRGGDSGLRQRGRHGGQADGAPRDSRSSRIVEYDGAVYNPKGLDIAALQKHRKETGSITGFRGRRRDGQERRRCSCECDVLLPAATENVITSVNADRIRCRILCEGANGPTTPLAEVILATRRSS